MARFSSYGVRKLLTPATIAQNWTPIGGHFWKPIDIPRCYLTRMCEEGLLEKVSYGFYRAMKHTARADQSLPSAMTRESVSATFCILHLRMCREELGDLLAALALSHKRNDLFGGRV